MSDETQEFILRAMASNYANGNLWDSLDRETCIKAADEIKDLRAQLAKSQAKVRYFSYIANSSYGKLGSFAKLGTINSTFGKVANPTAAGDPEILRQGRAS